MKPRKAYDYINEKYKKYGRRGPLDCQTADDGKAEQHHAKRVDVNNILAKYEKTGTLNFATKYQPMYGDIPSLDYAQALTTIMQAEDMFDELPSGIRSEFSNDPEKFLNFVESTDQADIDRSYEIGLRQHPEPPPAPPETQSPAENTAQPIPPTSPTPNAAQGA